MKRTLMAVMIGTLIFLAAGCNSGVEKVAQYKVTVGSHSAVTAAARDNVGWWMPRHADTLARIKEGNVDMVFVGDSITHFWERSGKEVWEKYYAGRNAVNLGFSGDRTQHVIWRLENGEIAGINPKVAIIMIGTNNSNRDDNTAKEIADGIVVICQKLRAELPETKILLLGIFPRGPMPSAQREKNAEASKIASKAADNKWIYYLNINDKFLGKDGELSKDIMPDFLHPNEKGYQIWAEAIEPTVVKLMSKK